MANKDVKDILKRDDAWHWKENEMLAQVLTEGDPERRRELTARLKELQPTYGDGTLDVPEEMLGYLLRRGNLWNMKENLAVMAVWSGDKTAGIKAIDGMMEAFRDAYGSPQPVLTPIEPYTGGVPQANSGLTTRESYSDGLTPVDAYSQQIDRKGYEKLIAGVLQTDPNSVHNLLRNYKDKEIVAVYNHIISTEESGRPPQVRFIEFLGAQGPKHTLVK